MHALRIFYCHEQKACEHQVLFPMSVGSITLVNIRLYAHMMLLIHISSGKQHHRLNMCIIVQTDIHIFLNDKQLKLDGFQPLSIGLTLWVNLNFRNQRLHQLPLFLFIHYGIQLFKTNQNLVDIISSQFLGFDCHFLCSSNDQQIFRIFNLIIHLVKSIIKIRLACNRSSAASPQRGSWQSQRRGSVASSG